MITQLLISAALVGIANAQVTATGTMGVTNPSAAVMGTPVNQSSDARLLSVNAIDDFCIFAPPEPGKTIGDTEAEQVAWCVQPRNNARVIPDGTLTAVHFVRTPLYYQVQGWGDFTKLNIAQGDMGGELDPHGATGAGNPVGGNVTVNATGQDVSYEEWMNYMSFEQFCIRVCIAETADVSAAIQCQHTLDEMGCAWVMPGDYTRDSFTDCKADAAVPPGLYPQANGSTSTFAQRYTLTQTQDGALTHYTIGYTVTPSTPFSTPASSECTTYSTVSNGIPPAALSSDAAFTYTPGMTFENLPTQASGNDQGQSVTATAQAAAAGKTNSGAGRAVGVSAAALIVGVVAVLL